DALAVTEGPGLAGSLLVGVNWAKAVAYARGLPLVAVNHLESHLYSNWLLQPGEDGETPPPSFPLVCLIVSGGHTELVLMTGHGPLPVATLAAAEQEAFVEVLVQKTVRAARATGATMVLLAGGVAANQALRERLGRALHLPLRYPPLDLCTDNAAMVGAAAHF